MIVVLNKRGHDKQAMHTDACCISKASLVCQSFPLYSAVQCSTVQHDMVEHYIPHKVLICLPVVSVFVLNRSLTYDCNNNNSSSSPQHGWQLDM